MENEKDTDGRLRLKATRRRLKELNTQSKIEDTIKIHSFAKLSYKYGIYHYEQKAFFTNINKNELKQTI